MKYYTIKPSRRLAPFVRYYWVLESEDPYTHYSMADVCPELMFHYKGRFLEHFNEKSPEHSFISGVHAQTSSLRKFSINKGFGIFGIYLYPHAIPLLFRIAAPELTNEMPDLYSLLHHQGSDLEDKMLNAFDNLERFSIAENFIASKISLSYTSELPVFNSIKYIIQKKGLVKINQVATDHYVSERQFERQFKQLSGFSPKLFSRIVRFQAVISQYGKNNKSLTDIALENGYYDQSHFIHDFKKFSGHKPGEYFSGESDATKWRQSN